MTHGMKSQIVKNNTLISSRSGYRRAGGKRLQYSLNLVFCCMCKLNITTFSTTVSMVIVALPLLNQLCSCSSTESYVVENTGIHTADSIRLQWVDTITLNIGNRIRPVPCSSQIVNFDSIAKYVILDENKLHVFDLANDTLIVDIDMKDCGALNNYSGFIFLNEDTIFSYDYGNKSCMLSDVKGHILNSQTIPGDLIEKVSPEALSCTPALSIGERVYLSGKPISHSSISKEDPVSLYWEYNNHKFITGASYSDEYSKGYFGGIYYNTIYQCLSDNNLITYSFPVSNYIYRYDKNLEFVDSLYMGSRYTKSIKSKEGNVMDFLSDKEERLKYYLEQDSYGQIFYNDKEKLYYRLAEHPLIESDSEKTRKPFSIIVMDNEGRLLTETPVLNEDGLLITINAHVYEDGIIIQMESEDENVIKFAFFKTI